VSLQCLMKDLPRNFPADEECCNGNALFIWLIDQVGNSLDVVMLLRMSIEVIWADESE
jgi:hypothetical protein